jgi:predicted nuclease of predicted toxin-antitoxin system
LGCRLLPAESFVPGVSRQDYAKRGDGRLFTGLKAELDLLNGGKKNNSRDALIAEAAIANGYILLTADCDLHSAAKKHGGKVTLFTRPQNESDNAIDI